MNKKLKGQQMVFCPRNVKFTIESRIICDKYDLGSPGVQ